MPGRVSHIACFFRFLAPNFTLLQSLLKISRGALPLKGNLWPTLASATQSPARWTAGRIHRASVQEQSIRIPPNLEDPIYLLLTWSPSHRVGETQKTVERVEKHQMGRCPSL